MKNNSKIALKSLAAAAAIGVVTTNPFTTFTVEAASPLFELVDETDEWNKEGETEYENVTPEEQATHDNSSNTQDADAHVDNSHGGTEETTRPDPVPTGNSDPRQGEVTDWENYNPNTDPYWNAQNPVLPDNLEDEVDRKDDEPEIVKTGDSMWNYAAVGLAGGMMVTAGVIASYNLVVDSKRRYSYVKKDVKKLTKTNK